MIGIQNVFPMRSIPVRKKFEVPEQAEFISMSFDEENKDNRAICFHSPLTLESKSCVLAYFTSSFSAQKATRTPNSFTISRGANILPDMLNTFCDIHRLFENEHFSLFSIINIDHLQDLVKDHASISAAS